MSKHFKLEEFACSSSGQALMNEQLLQALEEIRERLGEPMIITSGYRSDQHPITQSKIDKGAKHGGAHHLGYAADVMSAHGFRSTASTILHEQGWNHDAIEAQLAHLTGSNTSRAYNRSIYLPERRKMMQEWSNYLEQLSCK